MSLTAVHQLFHQPPTNPARLVLQLIAGLVETTGVQEEHAAYQSLRAVRSFKDLAALDWAVLQCALSSPVTCSPEQMVRNLATGRRGVQWALLHHQLYRARSSSTLLSTGRWRLPLYVSHPELALAWQQVQQLMADLDATLAQGRAALTRFQRFALQGAASDILQGMLEQAGACLSEYRQAHKQISELLAMIAWYLDQVDLGPANLVRSSVAA